MKFRRKAYLVGLLIPLLLGCTSSPHQNASASTKSEERVVQPLVPNSSSDWQLVFDDEFEGSIVDSNRWVTEDPEKTGRNNELQAYTSGAFAVADGVLQITARRGQDQYVGKARDYTSGMMTTRGKFSFRYGLLEVRVNVPRGQGLWPAVWMMADSTPLHWPPEIDLLEVLGHETSSVHFANHWGADSRDHHSIGGVKQGIDFAEGFHVVSMAWEPGLITWYVDGESVFTSTQNVSSEPMFILIDLAVGGDWPGSPGASTVFPANFNVDYVRVYQR